MVEFCVYFSYRAALALITALPLRPVFLLGKGLGFVAWLLLPTYRQLARRNTEIAFGPEKSAAEKKRIVRRHFQQLGGNLLSGMKLNSMPLERVARLVTIQGADEVHRHLRAGRPVILVLSHLGNWEFLAQILPQYFSYRRLEYRFIKNSPTAISIGSSGNSGLALGSSSSTEAKAFTRQFGFSAAAG